LRQKDLPLNTRAAKQLRSQAIDLSARAARTEGEEAAEELLEDELRKKGKY
jgi:hypothetical protein